MNVTIEQLVMMIGEMQVSIRFGYEPRIRLLEEQLAALQPTKERGGEPEPEQAAA